MQSRCIILPAMSVSRRFFARRKHEFSSWACLPLMAVGLNHPTAEKIKKAVKKFWTEHRDKASPLDEESSEPGSKGGHAEQEDLFSRLFTGSPTYKISGKQVRSGYTSFRSPSWAMPCMNFPGSHRLTATPQDQRHGLRTLFFYSHPHHHTHIWYIYLPS